MIANDTPVPGFRNIEATTRETMAAFDRLHPLVRHAFNYYPLKISPVNAVGVHPSAIFEEFARRRSMPPLTGWTPLHTDPEP